MQVSRLNRVLPGLLRPGRLASGLLLYLVLVQPNHPSVSWAWAIRQFPLDWPLLLLACLSLGSRPWLTNGFRLLMSLLLALLVLSKLADQATFVAYQREFNVLVDGHLLHAAWMFASGSIGWPLAAAVLTGTIACLIALLWLLWWALGQWLQAAGRPGRLSLLTLAMLVVVVAEIGHEVRAWRLPVDLPGTAFSARMVYERGLQIGTTLRDLRAFRLAAEADPLPARFPHGTAHPDLLAHLRGHHVNLVYVESYGRSSIDNPDHAALLVPTLRSIEASLRARGLAMRSGFLTAPMVGGQSWLSHGSVAAGLWLDTQGRYRALLASPRRTLFHFARDAGFRTLAVMPAITRAWPEGDFFGFDRILDAAALGYRGKPYNWVTMPDQYTLEAFDRLERFPARTALFSQIALISSHAPWTPLPPLVPWERIGDGRIFNTWAERGDPPAVLWQDEERIRAAFRNAILYSLRVIGAYAERHASDPGLLVVIGDHEPAGFVSQVSGFDTPIHLIGPPELIRHIDAWDWSEGMIPASTQPAWRMDTFRDRFVEAYSRMPEGPIPALSLTPAERP